MGHKAPVQHARPKETRWPGRGRAILSLVLFGLCCFALLRSRGASGRDPVPIADARYRPADGSGEATGYDAYPLTLKTPRYNLLVLRSILQHSNTSWQTTPKEARGHFVQSLIWMQMVKATVT